MNVGSVTSESLVAHAGNGNSTASGTGISGWEMNMVPGLASVARPLWEAGRNPYSGRPASAGSRRPTILMEEFDTMRRSTSSISTGRESISILALAPPDPDGDPLVIHAWAACVDTSGRSTDPACDEPQAGQAAQPRECGAIDGSDHDGLGTSAANPPYAKRHVVESAHGFIELGGLAEHTLYRICVATYDGFQGSYLNDLWVVRTKGSYPPLAPVSRPTRALLALALAGAGLLAARGRAQNSRVAFKVARWLKMSLRSDTGKS